MGKIKVLQVIPSFGVGGAETVVLSYLAHYDRSKMDMKAVSISPKSGSIYDKVIDKNSYNVVYLDKKHGVDLSVKKKLKAIVEEYQPDVIHSHMSTMKYLLPSLKYCQRTKGKENFSSFHTFHTELKMELSLIDWLVNLYCFHFKQTVPVVLHEGMIDKVNEYYKVKSAKVIRNGVNFERYESKDEIDKRLERQSLGLAEDAFVIGHVGSFQETKNHDYLIDIFQEVVKKRDNSYLVLVGDGPLRKSIELKVKRLDLADRVLFLGTRNDVPEVLSAMDVFVVPSLNEGFGIAILEAQAAELRCVVSDKVNRNVYLTDKVVMVGLNEDAESWAKTILDDTIEGQAFDELDNYRIENVMDELYKLYRGQL